MAYEFKLPDIGEGVVEGEIVRWLIQEGDTLAQDQPMVEIMTDKATVEIPAPRPGKVLKRMFAEGDLCPVGQVLISIDEGGNAQAAPVAEQAAKAAPSPKAESPRPAPAKAEAPRSEQSHGGGNGSSTHAVHAVPSPPAQPEQTVLATPATRKLARELDVDLASVSATGPNGRVTSEDVRGAAGGRARRAPAAVAAMRAAVPLPAASQDDVRVPFRGMRRKIAERMLQSKHSTAHFTYVEEVDASILVNLRTKANDRLKQQGIKISYLPFVIKACVAALKRFPKVNSYLDEEAGEIVQRRQYNIGIATATENGLMVPVIHNADQRSLVDLAAEVQRLADAARKGTASREDLTGSTFTITSLGQLGGIMFTPVINYPEVAIMGVTKIVRRPVAIDDKIEIREMLNLAMSSDHRLVDGYDAALFVAAVKEALETPGLLFLESV